MSGYRTRDIYITYSSEENKWTVKIPFKSIGLIQHIDAHSTWVSCLPIFSNLGFMCSLVLICNAQNMVGAD